MVLPAATAASASASASTVLTRFLFHAPSDATHAHKCLSCRLEWSVLGGELVAVEAWGQLVRQVAVGSSQ